MVSIGKEPQSFIDKFVSRSGVSDAVAGMRICRAVLQALRRRLLFEETLFIFEHLPDELKVVYADGWKVNKKENFEEAQFKDIYDLIREVKNSDPWSSSSDFPTFGAAIRYIKAIFLILYEYLPASVMRSIIGFLPQDFQHLIFEYEKNTPVGYRDIEYKNIYFVLETGKDKEKKTIFLKKLAMELGFPGDTEKAEVLFKEFLHSIRRSISFKDSVKLMSRLPVYIKYFYVDNWKTLEKQPFEKRKDEVLPDLLFLNNLVDHSKFYQHKQPIEEILQLFHALSGLLSEGERFRLKILLKNHSNNYAIDEYIVKDKE
jgi:uncharacterized protein (DUF2267 family)